eukprot:Polyplicarium_translucidae@DN3347_c0_g1_i16.p1
MLLIAAWCLIFFKAGAARSVATPTACGTALEIVHLQDLTNSYDEDLPSLREFFPRFAADVMGAYPESKFSVASYRDKTVWSLGFNEAEPGFQEDYCFKLATAMTSEMGAIQDAVDSFSASGGADPPENQIEALMYAARSPEVAWSRSRFLPSGRRIQKLAILATDAEYHKAGDMAVNNYIRTTFYDLPPFPFVPNNGDSILNCTGEDYPSVAQVNAVLVEQNVFVVILATDEVVDVYREFAATLDVPVVVETVAQDSSNILAALSTGIRSLEASICRAEMPTAACPLTLDVMHLQELSGPKGKFIDRLGAQAEAIFQRLDSWFPNSRFGAAQYLDGRQTEQHWGRCFELQAELSPDPKATIDALQRLAAEPALRPGTVLEALLHAALNFPADPKQVSGTRKGRVLVAPVDAPFLREGDAGRRDSDVPWIANDGDEYLGCSFEDFPTVKQVRKALEDREVFVVFLVVGEDELVRSFEQLLRDLGGAGVATQVRGDGTDLLDRYWFAIPAVAQILCDGNWGHRRIETTSAAAPTAHWADPAPRRATPRNPPVTESPTHMVAEPEPARRHPDSSPSQVVAEPEVPRLPPASPSTTTMCPGPPTPTEFIGPAPCCTYCYEEARCDCPNENCGRGWLKKKGVGKKARGHKRVSS